MLAISRQLVLGMRKKQNGGKTMEEQNTVQETKFCKECGQRISRKAVICPHCGCQVEDMAKNEAPQQIVINNTNQNSNQNQNVNAGMAGVRLRKKWVSFLLCLFLGYFGAHKFYEGKTLMGVLYLFTGGLCFFGVIFDLIALLGKPDPYIVI